MLNNNWDTYLKEIYKESWYIELLKRVENEYMTKTIFPAYENIFNALKYTDYNNVKAVIIGQDPYHGENEAHGFAFSVQDGIKLPPSLKNIYKELYNDLGIINNTGDLTKWAEEGILLLNSILTVEKDKPLSHKDLGWERLTDEIISIINKKSQPIVFILWGAKAKEKKELISNPIHCIIESSHPSPFSVHKGFYGSKVFSNTNNFLISKNIKPINFKL